MPNKFLFKMGPKTKKTKSAHNERWSKKRKACENIDFSGEINNLNDSLELSFQLNDNTVAVQTDSVDMIDKQTQISKKLIDSSSQTPVNITDISK